MNNQVKYFTIFFLISFWNLFGASSRLIVEKKENLVVQISTTNTACDIENGIASVIVKGGVAPYYIEWSNGERTPEIYNLSKGYYEVTVTDAYGKKGSVGGMVLDDCDIYPGGRTEGWIPFGNEVNGENDYDIFGNSVALSSDGSIMAVGADGNDQNGSSSGSAQVFQYNNGTWQQMGSTIYGDAANDRFGYSVALSSDGNILAVGAYGNDDNGVDSGQVKVYTYNGSDWVQLGATLNGEAASDFFGFSISLSDSGNIIAISAKNNSDVAYHSGQVSIYSYDGSNWQQMGNDLNGTNSQETFGNSVSLAADGNTVAIGIPFNDDNGSSTGKVVVYNFNGSNWTQIGNSILGDAITNTEFGWAVSLSADGTKLAASALRVDLIAAQYNGYTRVFSYNGSSWVQMGSDINQIDSNVISGRSIALSADGNTVAIGEPDEASFNNEISSSVRVFTFTNGDWEQLGASILGYADDDYFGVSLAISDDGSIVASGNSLADNGGTNVGSVRVLELTDANLICSSGDFPGEITYDIPVSGGVGSYAYLWEVSTDGGVNWAPASGTNTNETYMVDFVVSENTQFRRKVTDSGCSTGVYAEPIEFIYLPEINLSFSSVAGTCGNDNAEATVIVSGGTYPFTYLWDTGDTTATVTGLAAGDYEVTVTDLLGCSKTATVTVTVNTTNTIVINTVVSPASCSMPDGSVSLSVSGGQPPYLYYWSTGDDTATVSGLYAGVYEVTVLDDSGCSKSKTVTITGSTNLNPGIGGNDWSQIGNTINGEAAGDSSGTTLALSDDGNIVAIGSVDNGGNGDDSGHVRVFSYSGSNWVQLGMDIDGEAADDESGRGLDISADGSVVAIGARNNDGNGSNSGHVRIFNYDGSNWIQKGTDIEGESSPDAFGNALSLSADGNTVAVGAQFFDGVISNCGQVRVFKFDGTDWVLMGAGIEGQVSSGAFGVAVSLSDNGNILAVGSPSTNGTTGNNGHVKVFSFDGINWNQIGANIVGEASGDRFGVSVKLSEDGSILAVGASFNGGNGDASGHVRVFQNVGGNWQQLGTDIDGEAAYDFSGIALSLSADGTIVGIGAGSNDMNGSNSGSARVFQYNGTDWVLLGSNMYGENNNDRFGTEIALSAIGNKVAISSVGADYNGNASGSVQLFDLNLNIAVCGTDIPGVLTYDTPASGGSGNYTYLWEVSNNNGSTWSAASGTNNQETYTPVAAVTNDTQYRRKVTDTGCGSSTYSNSITFTVSPEIILNFIITDTTCGIDNGEVTVTASGGLAPYSYLWETGDTTETVTGLAAGVYEVVVTDANSCTKTATVTINELCTDSWIGVVSSDWNTPGNWDLGIVPSALYDAIIPPSAPNQPVITSGVELNSLAVDAGALVTVSDAGTLIITSAAIGLITVERSIETDWYFASCPVNDQTIADFVANNNLVSGTGGTIAYTHYTTANDTWDYLTQTELTNSGGDFIVLGEGVAVQKNTPGYLTYTGTYNALNTTLSLGTGGIDDYNLVGNPFIANINLTSLLTANSAVLNEKTLWFWDGSKYIPKNELTGGLITPLESFMISGGTGVGYISFSSSLMESAGVIPPDPIANLTGFTLEFNNGTQSMGTDIYLVSGATTDVDNGYDSSMFLGQQNDLAVYTTTASGISTKQLAIQALPLTGLDQTLIPVGVTELLGGTVTFSLSMQQNFGSNHYVYLYDNVTGNTIQLDNGGIYEVTLPAGTNGTGRFYLNITSTPLNSSAMEMNNIRILAKNNTLTLMGLEEDSEVTIFSMLGQQLYDTKVLAAASQQIQVALAKSTYIVRVTNTSGSKVAKVILGK